MPTIKKLYNTMRGRTGEYEVNKAAEPDVPIPDNKLAQLPSSGERRRRKKSKPTLKRSKSAQLGGRRRRTRKHRTRKHRTRKY